jgi:hypothetical protein
MNKKPTTSGLRPEKLAQVLNIFSEEQSKDTDLPSDQIKAELLQDRLAETLLKGSQKHSTLRKELTHLCCLAGLASSEPIRNLLNNPETDLEIIEKIKEHGKRLTTETSSEAEHETANVIYYAAVASALIFHDDKITQFPLKKLEKAFSVFVDTEWVSSDLIDLFKKAVEYCREQASNKLEK